MVCWASPRLGDSDQLQPVLLNEVMLPPPDAVTEVMVSSNSVMAPLAVAVLFSSGLDGELVTLVVGFTSVGVKLKLVVPVEPSALVTVTVMVCAVSPRLGDSDQLQP